MEFQIIHEKSSKPIAFAALELKQVMKQYNYLVSEFSLSELEDAEGKNQVIITTRNHSQAQRIVKKADKTHNFLLKEGYYIRRETSAQLTRIWVIGGDEVGAMYGALELAETLRTETNLNGVYSISKNPFIKNRGIKFNIPLDARTPSYADNGDAAQSNIKEVWELNFWIDFLDEMARDHYNVLSLWNLHPFPSLIRVPEYPEIALDDVKKETGKFPQQISGQMKESLDLNNLETIKKMSIQDKIDFWRQVMRHAKNRGIDIYIFTWNIFIYGTENSKYPITDSIDNDITQDYFRKSVRTLFETYPELAGIGVTAGESQQMIHSSPEEAEKWLWETYGKGIKDAKEKEPDRQINFIHRQHHSNNLTITKFFKELPDFETDDTFSMCFKYSWAHMYSSEKPRLLIRDTSINDFLDDLPENKKTWLTLRNDDYYLLRWGDPDFARQYLTNLPTADKLAGFLMGPDGYVWGKESACKNRKDNPLYIKRHWYSFRIWGLLAYDPTIPNSKFRDMLGSRYAKVSKNVLYHALSSVSKIFPEITKFHWRGPDYQWYPEACYSRSDGFHDVNNFIKNGTMPGEELISIEDYVEAKLNNKTLSGKDPIRVAECLKQYANMGIRLLEEIRLEDANNDLDFLLSDIRSLANLGLYYGDKLLGAVYLKLYRETKHREYKNQAINHLNLASSHWSMYAFLFSQQYHPQVLSRLGSETVDMIKLQENVDLDIKIAVKE